MAKYCDKCGKKLGFFNEMPHGSQFLCMDCWLEIETESAVREKRSRTGQTDTCSRCCKKGAGGEYSVTVAKIIAGSERVDTHWGRFSKWSARYHKVDTRTLFLCSKCQWLLIFFRRHLAFIVFITIGILLILYGALTGEVDPIAFGGIVFLFGSVFWSLHLRNTTRRQVIENWVKSVVKPQLKASYGSGDFRLLNTREHQTGQLENLE